MLAQRVGGHSLLRLLRLGERRLRRGVRRLLFGAARELGLAQLPLLLRDGLAEPRGVLRPERLGGRGLLLRRGLSSLVGLVGLINYFLLLLATSSARKAAAGLLRHKMAHELAKANRLAAELHPPPPPPTGVSMREAMTLDPRA